MGDFRILIADPDREFVETLVGSASRLFAANVRLRAVTRPELLSEAFSHGLHPHVLLVAEEWLDMPIDAPEGCLVVGLGESRRVDGAGQAGRPAAVVPKYQPLFRMIDGLKLLYREHFPDRKVDEQRQTSVMTFYSTQGGAGKSTVAFLLAERLAARGRRVLLLSLENVSWLPLRCPDSARKNGFSRALYCVKTDPDGLAGKWEQLRSTDAETGIDFLSPVSETAEWAETTESDISRLIGILSGMNAYDRILLDLDSSPSSRLRAAFATGGPIWWLLTEDEACLYKTSILRNQKRNDVFPDVFGSRAVVRFILNKARRPSAELFERYGIPLVASLPWAETCAPGRNDDATERLADAVFETFHILEEGQYPWKRNSDSVD